MRIIFYIVAVCVAGLLVGCSSTSVNQNSSANTVRQVQVDTTFQYPPLQDESFSGLDPEAVGLWEDTGRLEIEEYTLSETFRAVPDSADTNFVLIESTGYRVQIFTGKIQRHAQNLKEVLEQRFEEAVYLIYEAPQYKVRMGNFVSREEAQSYCNRIRRNGYPGAWVVRSRIEVKKFVNQ